MSSTEYVRGVMDATIKAELLAHVDRAMPAPMSAVKVVAHLIECGMIPDHYAKHYVIWRSYRDMLCATTRTPTDIMGELAASHGVDLRTIRRIVNKMTAPVTT